MQFFNRDFTESDVDETILFTAATDVNHFLRSNGITTPATDMDDMLSAAELCFYMEVAAMTRQIENAFGVVGQETIGDWTKKYENGMPMFFFAQGSSKPFLALLPHETWRMRGFKYITAYVETYFFTTYGKLQANASLAEDPNMSW